MGPTRRTRDTSLLSRLHGHGKEICPKPKSNSYLIELLFLLFVPQNLPLIHCYTNKSQQGVKLETRSNMTPGGTMDRRREGVGSVSNPFRVGLWNTDVSTGTERESCTYYEPVQHI